VATADDDRDLDASLRRRHAYRRGIERHGLGARERLLCAADVVHWLSHWGFTYDPRVPQSHLPFDPFTRQVAFLRWLEERERLQQDGLCEKARDMGVTYLACAFALHRWLFRPGFSAGFGSRKLELVDKIGDPDSIFEKLRILLSALPAWMRPRGFSRDEQDNQARLVNPQTGATITGEGGDNIGRGGRKSVYFIDEAAFLEHPERIERSLSQTTRVRIDVSTPQGRGNPFAAKRWGGVVPVFTFHWKMDPRKDDTWYAAQKEKYKHDPVLIAQELDLDYDASVEGICIPGAWVRAAVDLDLPAGNAVEAGLDIGEEGPGLSVLIARRGPWVFELVHWGRSNTTDTAHRARDEAVRLKVEKLYYDVGGPGLGVKGTWQTTERTRRLPFTAVPVQAGETPSDRLWPDGRTSRELFANLRAELWWLLRRRFEKTYEYVAQGVKHPPEEMVSIPDHPQLIAELSVQRYEREETGKIRMVSKARMRAEGIKSPDFADALCLSFYPKGPALAVPCWVEERRPDLLRPDPTGLHGLRGLGARAADARDEEDNHRWHYGPFGRHRR
jgi:phage terminase large subunit